MPNVKTPTMSNPKPCLVNGLRFGELAIEMGYLHPDEVQECLDFQRMSKVPCQFGRICLNLNFMTYDMLRNVLSRQVQRFQKLFSACGREARFEMGLTFNKGTKHRVLLVDQHLRVRHFAKMIMEHEVTLARTEQEAFEAARQSVDQPFELIIIEIEHLGASAVKLARELRRFPQNKSVPMLFLSLSVELDRPALEWPFNQTTDRLEPIEAGYRVELSYRGN